MIAISLAIRSSRQWSTVGRIFGDERLDRLDILCAAGVRNNRWLESAREATDTYVRGIRTKRRGRYDGDRSEHERASRVDESRGGEGEGNDHSNERGAVSE